MHDQLSLSQLLLAAVNGWSIDPQPQPQPQLVKVSFLRVREGREEWVGKGGDLAVFQQVC